jgi:hypothetical protein
MVRINAVTRDHPGRARNLSLFHDTLQIRVHVFQPLRTQSVVIYSGCFHCDSPMPVMLYSSGCGFFLQ